MLRSPWTTRALTWVVVFLICKTVVAIVANYGDYFPPNFQSDFLLNRESHFFGAYRFAFYIHIIVSPLTLLSGLLLLNRRIRSRRPHLHRTLGKAHIASVLFLVVPSSLWMSAYAFSGNLAGSGFAILSLVTALCAVQGWIHARERRFEQHQLWMNRCFVLLCSAIVLRLVSGAGLVMGLEAWWLYPMCAWGSWVLQIAIFEAFHRLQCRS